MYLSGFALVIWITLGIILAPITLTIGWPTWITGIILLFEIFELFNGQTLYCLMNIARLPWIIPEMLVFLFVILVIDILMIIFQILAPITYPTSFIILLLIYLVLIFFLLIIAALITVDPCFITCGIIPVCNSTLICLIEIPASLSLFMFFECCATVTIFFLGIPFSCMGVILSGFGFIGVGLCCLPLACIMPPCYIFLLWFMASLFCGFYCALQIVPFTWGEVTLVIWFIPCLTVSYEHSLIILLILNIIIILIWTIIAVILSGSPGYIFICIAIILLLTAIIIIIFIAVVMFMVFFPMISFAPMLIIVIIVIIIGIALLAIGGGGGPSITGAGLAIWPR
jgi:hypothetical protein